MVSPHSGVRVVTADSTNLPLAAAPPPRPADELEAAIGELAEARGRLRRILSCRRRCVWSLYVWSYIVSLGAVGALCLQQSAFPLADDQKIRDRLVVLAIALSGLAGLVNLVAAVLHDEVARVARLSSRLSGVSSDAAAQFSYPDPNRTRWEVRHAAEMVRDTYRALLDDEEQA